MLLRFLAVIVATALVGFAHPETQAGDEVSASLLGTWTEATGGSSLTLRSDGSAAWNGEKASWRRFGSKKLRFKRGAEVERPVFALENGALTIHWKSGVQRYTKVDAGFPEVPPALEVGGAARGKSRLWKHPRDYFTCELPDRWQVEAIDDWVMVVDPGLEGEDTLEAIVFVGWGELEGAEEGKTPVQLMKQYESEWLRQLSADGLRLRKAKTPPRRVLVGDVPGAEQEWAGKAQNGQSIRLWAGSIVKRDAFLYVAALAVDGKQPEYFPGAKRLFLSVIPTPPERNRPLEQRLAGKVIHSTTNNDSGGTGWKYTFHEDGSVESFWFLTGTIGLDIASTSQREWGTFEVYGDALYLYLKSGQVEGQIETDPAGHPVAILLEGSRYPL